MHDFVVRSSRSVAKKSGCRGFKSLRGHNLQLQNKMNLKKLLSTSAVEKKYLEAGRVFGDNLSYIFLGKCVEFEKNLDKLISWELEYAKRGFKTIPLNEFVEFGGYGKDIKNSLGKKRDAGEKPLYPAQNYKDILSWKEIFSD